jgi:hypothetical protein
MKALVPSGRHDALVAMAETAMPLRCPGRARHCEACRPSRPRRCRSPGSRASAPAHCGGKPLLPAVGANLLIRGSPPVTGPDELHRQEPTAGADRPAVAHPPADGGHDRRGDRRAAALPGAPAGGGRAGHDPARAPPSRSSRPCWPGTPDRSGSQRRHRPSGADPRPARAHLCRVGCRPLRRVSAIRLQTRPGRPVQAPGMRPGRAVSSCIREGVTRWQLKNASRC